MGNLHCLHFCIHVELLRLMPGLKVSPLSFWKTSSIFSVSFLMSPSQLSLRGVYVLSVPYPFFSQIFATTEGIYLELTPICLHTAVLKDSSSELQWPTVNAAEIQYAASLLYCRFYTSLHCIERHNLFAFLLNPIWHRSFSDASSLMTGSTCLCTASGIGYFRNLKIMLNFYIENKATAT